MQEIPYYVAIALQTTCFSVNQFKDVQAARKQMLETIDRIGKQIKSSAAYVGKDVKLVVLPEYFLTGFPMGEPLPVWREKACLAMDGPEYEAMSKLAQETGLFIGGNAYEVDPHWPELYFQTCFVIAPNGDVCLRYRRLNSMFAPTPHDVWDEYLDVYGLDGVFPVARTEIGALAALASEEILYPEVARCLAMRGAEILIHPTSDVGGDARSPKEVTKLARAIENMAYVVSANSARIEGVAMPAASADGGSKIIDFKGHVLAEADRGESMVAYAEIDLPALRRHRRRPGMWNLLARQRFELYADSYKGNSFYPPNTFGKTVPERSHFVNTQLATIEKLREIGVISD